MLEKILVKSSDSFTYYSTLYLGYTMTDGEWKATDGSPMTYMNWLDEDNSKPSQEKPCVALRADGKMEPVKCEGSSGELPELRDLPKTCIGKKAVKGKLILQYSHNDWQGITRQVLTC